jgi:hypothetical protein
VSSRPRYPDGSIFVDADWPTLGVLIAQAADEGRTLVLWRRGVWPARPDG